MRSLSMSPTLRATTYRASGSFRWSSAVSNPVATRTVLPLSLGGAFVALLGTGMSLSMP